MAKYVKLKIFQTLGFLRQKFDGKEFRKSKVLYVKSFFIIFLTISASFKFTLSVFFEREDVRQLYIGSFVNFLSNTLRLMYGLLGKLNLLKLIRLN